MNHPMRLLLSAALLPALALAADQAPPRLEDLPDPPPPPDMLQSGETLEPEVTIIQRDDAEVEEYRMGGRLYMIKVTPVRGPSYYLVDTDGDGMFDRRMSELYNDFVVPQWVIFSW